MYVLNKLKYVLASLRRLLNFEKHASIHVTRTCRLKHPSVYKSERLWLGFLEASILDLSRRPTRVEQAFRRLPKEASGSYANVRFAPDASSGWFSSAHC